MNAQALQQDLKKHGRRAKRHPVMDALARAGIGAYGVVYLVLGWLALQVALGDREGAVDKTGALRQLAQEPWGEAALWAAVVGLAALAVWQGLETAVGHHGSDTKEAVWSRLRSISRTGVFAVVAYTAAKVALGSSSRTSTDGYTAWLMRQPLGPWLVGAVGFAIIGFAIGSAVIGLTDRYKHDLDLDGRTGEVGKALKVLARAGYSSRGVAFGVMGSLFVWAAVTHNAQRSGGLDQALARVVEAPFGRILLVAVAAGFACYGLLNLAKVRHLRN
ncbi:MAG TPA: DUF1206 domain-containing protein [Nocardioidaceae bacterium]|nr:DUF1206 domain-containing protein [Nocardioidaceae bacterium]